MSFPVIQTLSATAIFHCRVSCTLHGGHLPLGSRKLHLQMRLFDDGLHGENGILASLRNPYSPPQVRHSLMSFLLLFFLLSVTGG